jgi:hypothetical protein
MIGPVGESGNFLMIIVGLSPIIVGAVIFVLCTVLIGSLKEAAKQRLK